jgi:hypothetical protein
MNGQLFIGLHPHDERKVNRYYGRICPKNNEKTGKYEKGGNFAEFAVKSQFSLKAQGIKRHGQGQPDRWDSITVIFGISRLAVKE